MSEGFVGVGIGRYEGAEALRVYVADADCSIMQRLKDFLSFVKHSRLLSVISKEPFKVARVGMPPREVRHTERASKSPRFGTCVFLC